jgi:hypothetical protein
MAHASKEADFLVGSSDLHGLEAFVKNMRFWDVVPMRYDHPSHPSNYGNLERWGLIDIFIGHAPGINVDLGRRSAQYTELYLKKQSSDFERVQAHTYMSVLAQYLAAGLLEGRQLHVNVDDPKCNVSVHTRALIDASWIASKRARGKPVDWALVAYFPALMADVATVGPEFHEASKVRARLIFARMLRHLTVCN